MGHAYLAAGQLSELSERRVLGGNQHAPACRAVCRRRLHGAGSSAPGPEPGRGVHYSGSPLPLSLAEANYNHQVLEVTFEGASWPSFERIPVPRAVEMIRLPQSGLDEALQAIEARWTCPLARRRPQPFLEVRLLLPPNPRPASASAYWPPSVTKPVRLARITTSYQGLGPGAGGWCRPALLDELSPPRCFASAISVSSTGSRRPNWWRRLKRSLEQVKESSQ